MNKNVQFFIGIDVSKLWFDVTIMAMIKHIKQPMESWRFDNTAEGITALHQLLLSKDVSFDENSLLVIENTGIYHRLIWEYCSSHSLPIHIGNAAHIKWSLGIVRGKNDKVDSQRLCSFAFKNAQELKASPILNPVFIRLKDMITSRSRLMSQINSIKVYLKELKLSNTKEVQKIIEKAHKAALEGMQKSMEQIEAQIMIIIKDDASLKKSYDLLTSIPGIGPVTAVYMICCTNNFAGKRTGKQLAAYAGVVPYENTSGTSIKHKKKVHKMANKDLKKLLHLCALVAIKHDLELKQYFERKKTEGKHTLAILNAIRNKLVLRAVAVIRKQREYVNNYKNAA